MNRTNATTFCEFEDKKELRSRGRKTQERYNIMISIKNDLFRCCKNVITITKDEMQSLRRKLYEIKNENVPFTMKEHEIFEECKNAIKNLRISHPEIFEVQKNTVSQPMSQKARVIEQNKDIFVKVPSKPKQQLKKSSTRSAVSNYNGIIMDSSDIYTASTSSKKCETKTNHKVSHEAKLKVSSKHKHQIKKQSTDSVLNYRMNASNTQIASSTSNEIEAEVKIKILEVFRQAKEIIDHYSHQVCKM